MSNIDNSLIDANIRNRKTYLFDDTTYYKVRGKKSYFYIKVSNFDELTSHQINMTLYEYTASGLVKVRAYVKSIDYSDILLISAPTVSSPFKMHDLEMRV